MAIVSISRVQSRRGLKSDLPINLAEGELGWCLDTRELFIGNGPGYGGNTALLTQFSNVTGSLQLVAQTISGTVNNGNIYITPAGSGNVVISNLTVTGSSIGVVTYYNPPETGGIPRTQQDKSHDVVSLKDFFAVGDGITDNTVAVQAADNTAGPIFVPQGRYLTALTNGQAAAGIYYGLGQIMISGAGQARQFVHITSDVPTATKNQYQYFDTAFAKAHSTQYTYVGPSVGSNASIISNVQTIDGASMTAQVYDYAGGINVGNALTTSGRSDSAANMLNVYHGGQGTAMGWNFIGTANTTNPSAIYRDALPKTQVMGATLNAAVSNVIMSGHTFAFNDNNFNVTVMGHKIVYTRNGAESSLGKIWIHDRPESAGTQYMDVAYNPQGAWSKVLDTSAVILDGNQSAILLTAGQKIYLNSFNAGDSQGKKYGATSVGNVSVTFNGTTNAVEFTVGGAVRLSLTQAGNIISQSLSSSTSFTNDVAAAAGGVSIGQFYRNGSNVMIRVT